MDRLSPIDGRPLDHGGGEVDRGVAELAGRQHGVVSRAQLRALGLSDRAVDGRIARGLLHPVHRGAFAVGHVALSQEGRWLAAVLAAGPGAVASHRCAGALHGLVPRAARPEVAVPTRGGRARGTVRVHRPLVLPPEHVTAVQGIPVTTVARTLVDLAGVLDRRRLERAVERAEELRTIDVRAIADVLDRLPRPRGIRALRSVLSEPLAMTRSEAEDRFVALVCEAGLPRPATNVHVALGDGRFAEVDALWAAHALVVEVDGWAFHRSRAQFERDRRRDAALQRVGLRVVRVTWRRLVEEPGEVADDVRALLDGSTGDLPTVEVANSTVDSEPRMRRR